MSIELTILAAESLWSLGDLVKAVIWPLTPTKVVNIVYWFSKNLLIRKGPLELQGRPHCGYQLPRINEALVKSF